MLRFYFELEYWSSSMKGNEHSSSSKSHPRVGVAVLIFDLQRESILLGRRKNAHGEGDWGLPGGHLEFGESLEECAIREVEEETGLQIQEPKFLGITNDHFVKEGKHYISIFMKVIAPLTQSPEVREPEKVSAWQWHRLDNLPSNLFLPLKNWIGGGGYSTFRD
jgi:8-oxo-dGTP diphosphatase